MTGYTPRLGLPYPEADTLITESAAIVQELAEKIEAALPTLSAGIAEPSTNEYIVAPHQLAVLESSGDYVMPDVNGDGSPVIVDVAVMCAGTRGQPNPPRMTTRGYPGEVGGRVWVWKSVKVAVGATMPVTVGVDQNLSAFGPLEVPYGAGANEPTPYGLKRSNDTIGSNGWDGLPGAGLILGPGGTRIGVCGSGGSGAGGTGMSTNPNYYQGQGVDGGGNGGHGGWSGSQGSFGGNGTPGKWGGGGGGGGGNGDSQTRERSGGASVGAVMIFSHSPASAQLSFRTHQATAMVALDSGGVALGVFSVDPDAPHLPGIDHDRLVDYPTDPIDTGRVTPAPMNADDPDGPTTDVPVLAWPAAGWTYTDTDGWKEPTP